MQANEIKVRTFYREWIWGILLLSLVLLGATLALGPRVAQAQSPTPDAATVNRMESIAKGLYCPVCVGVPLDVCDTQACEQWRALIVDQIRAGKTDQEIRQYFIDQYGDRVLGAPPPQGFNLGAYLLPLTIFVVGIGVVFVILRGWMRPRPSVAAATSAPAPPSIAPEYAERIARELERRERE